MYHKINTIFKRDPVTKKILIGEYSQPEFEYLKDNLWEWTEKVDGMNIRLTWDGTNLLLGGKTDKAQIPKGLVEKFEEIKESVSAKCLEFFGPVPTVLYGEGYGNGIQKGGNYIKGQDFIMFDIRCGDTWLESVNVRDICSKMGLKTVPVIKAAGTFEDAIWLVQNGFLSHFAERVVIAEGLVLRPVIELKDRRGHRIIAKIKSCDFKE